MLKAHNPSHTIGTPTTMQDTVQHPPVPGNPKDGTCQSDDLRYRKLILS